MNKKQYTTPSATAVELQNVCLGVNSDYVDPNVCVGAKRTELEFMPSDEEDSAEDK